MASIKDNYYGSILDPLHGDIKLSEIEKWCIYQPIFSRLRKVKQNTFLYYVFPSANHTRFEHSIGVMHLAGKVFDACKENYATGEKKLEKYHYGRPTTFFDLSLLGEKEEVYYQVGQANLPVAGCNCRRRIETEGSRHVGHRRRQERTAA